MSLLLLLTAGVVIIQGSCVRSPKIFEAFQGLFIQ